MCEAFLYVFRSTDKRPLVPILEAFRKTDRGDRLAEISILDIVLCGNTDTTTPPASLSALPTTSSPPSTTCWGATKRLSKPPGRDESHRSDVTPIATLATPSSE